MDYVEVYEVSVVSLSENESTETVEIKFEQACDEYVEKSKEDTEEDDAIIRLFGDGIHEVDDCCPIRCNKVIPQETAVAHRRSFQEMTKDEQDLVILAQLQAQRHSPLLQKYYGGRTKRKKSQCKEHDVLQRHSMPYFFHGLKICRKMYLWLYDLGKARLGNLCKHLDEHGLSQRVHALKNKPTFRKTNVLEPADIGNVVSFIIEYGKQCGTPVPGRLTKFRNCNVIKLPSDVTKQEVFKKYCDYAACEPTAKKIARSTFSGIWKKYCPYIIAPINDLFGKKKTPKPQPAVDLANEIEVVEEHEIVDTK